MKKYLFIVPILFVLLSMAFIKPMCLDGICSWEPTKTNRIIRPTKYFTVTPINTPVPTIKSETNTGNYTLSQPTQQTKQGYIPPATYVPVTIICVPNTLDIFCYQLGTTPWWMKVLGHPGPSTATPIP